MASSSKSSSVYRTSPPEGSKENLASGKFVKTRGLGWLVTGFFVVGDLAGGGLVALPTALIQTGLYPGVFLMILTAVILTFTSYLIGRSWTILISQWPDYRNHTRKPYAEIGFRANGPRMRSFVSVVVNTTQFMVAVVFVLLCSKNIQNLFKEFLKTNVSYCYVIICLAVCLLPLTFLKSPNDFWWAVIIAMFTTSAAVVLIIVGASIDYEVCHKDHHLPPFRPTNYFLALGTFLFAYGGHNAFPTIQHDMKVPSDFTKSTFVAFSATSLLYIPTGVVGVIAYGDSIRDSVIPSIQTAGIQQAVNILITIHLILTLILVFNPINQEFEEMFGVPQHFCWQRVFVRSSIMAAVAFVAESIPSFGPLLNLVGGSTTSLMAVLFPCLFYLYLVARQAKAAEIGRDIGPCSYKEVLKYNSKFMVCCCVAVFLFGLIGGGAATFSAIRDLTSAHFEQPCYLSAFTKSNKDDSSAHTNCCGRLQNLTSVANVTCSAPDLNFYTA